MIVATYASPLIKGYFEALSEKLRREGILFIAAEPTKFSWSALVKWELDMARAHPDEVLCFVDAWDFIMQGTREDLEMLAAKQDLLFHSDAHCFPEPHKADWYPPAPTQFRYINGTAPIGKGHVIAKAIEFGMSYFPIRGEESSIYADNDQRFWTDVYLENGPWTHRNYRIDHYCQLSVSLNSLDSCTFEIKDKKLIVQPIGVTPIFVHANGAAMKKYAKDLEVLL